MYTNDLPDNLTSTVKPFVYNMSLFSVIVKDPIIMSQLVVLLFRLANFLMKNYIFFKHMKTKLQKAAIRINVIKKLTNLLPQQALLTIYK